MNTHTDHDHEVSEAGVQEFTNVLVFGGTLLAIFAFVVAPGFDAALTKSFAVVWMLFALGMRRAYPVSLVMSAIAVMFVVVASIFDTLPGWREGNFELWWMKAYQTIFDGMSVSSTDAQ